MKLRRQLNAKGELEVPAYLAAFRQANLPANNWGPRRREDQNGLYEHIRLRPIKTNNKNHGTETNSIVDPRLTYAEYEQTHQF